MARPQCLAGGSALVGSEGGRASSVGSGPELASSAGVMACLPSDEGGAAIGQELGTHNHNTLDSCFAGALRLLLQRLHIDLAKEHLRSLGLKQDLPLRVARLGAG